MKLAMTLLVRNEADIVRDNMTFHLERGVDHVVAMDNGSDDGTRDILAEFERLGVATIIDEPEQNYAQAKWVTRMALLARDELQADWILNNDADEFWIPPSGNLKTGLDETEADSLSCRRRNMIFACDDEEPGAWYERIVYRIAQPVKMPKLADRLNDPLPCPYFYLDLQPKALVRAAGLVSVAQGNHRAVHSGDGSEQPAGIEIYHFPVRSASQFSQKIKQGGEAYARNTELPEGVGWHWRRWYAKIVEGRGEEALREALPTAVRLKADVDAGAVLHDETVKNLLTEQQVMKRRIASEA